MQVDIATIMQHLSGKSLREMDRILDDARRIVWTVQFIGGSWEQAARENGVEDDPALILACLCEGAPLSTVNAVLEEARFGCWMARRESLPASRYARQAAERAAFVAAPPATRAMN